jgi:HSP20 family molecular chaperone IbpA
MAKAILIDTDNLDLTKLGEVFGNDVAQAIAEAIGAQFNAAESDAELEDGSDDSDDLYADDDENEYVYGEVEVNDENSERYKVVLNFPYTDRDEVVVTEQENGVDVSASSAEGDEYFEEIRTSAPIDPSRTSVYFEDGKLTLRFYKLPEVVKSVGRQLEVN